MEGNFELNKAGWYTVRAVEENTFLNDKLETQDYGIWYSVAFQGNAEAILWQTKTAPIEDEKYWGYLEKTKSGKSIKFKWDKQNEPTGSSNSSSPAKPTENKYMKDTSDLPYRVWKDLLPFVDQQALLADSKYNDRLNKYVVSQANWLLEVIGGVREEKPKETEVIEEDVDRYTSEDWLKGIE